MTKQWPKGNKTVSVEKLTDPLRKAFEAGFDFKEKAPGQTIKWTGLPFGSYAAAIMHHPAELLGKKSLAYHKERGRDLLDVLLLIAVNSGFEQGRRHQADQDDYLHQLRDGFSRFRKEKSMLVALLETIVKKPSKENLEKAAEWVKTAKKQERELQQALKKNAERIKALLDKSDEGEKNDKE